jgi:hypothetical protein
MEIHGGPNDVVAAVSRSDDAAITAARRTAMMGMRILQNPGVECRVEPRDAAVSRRL